MYSNLAGVIYCTKFDVYQAGVLKTWVRLPLTWDWPPDIEVNRDHLRVHRLSRVTCSRVYICQTVDFHDIVNIHIVLNEQSTSGCPQKFDSWPMLVTSESIGVILIWSTGVLGYFSSCWSRNTWLSTEIHMQNAMSRPFFQTVKIIVTIKIFHLPYLKNKNEKFRMVYLFFDRISLFLKLHLNLNNSLLIIL